MSMQLQSTSTVLPVSLEKTELLRAIKNEPPESEIGFDDIPNSLDEEIIPDIKNIDIVSHEISEDLIKSETVSENTFENNHSGSVETQVFVKTENIPLIKTENVETVVTFSCKKDRKKAKVFEVPVIPIEPHTSLAKANHACNKNKSTHGQNKTRYCCEKCTYTSGTSSDFKFHQLTHKTKAEMDDLFLKYRCDKCNYRTFICSSLKTHKLTHLKPEESHYFYCYHCSYKSDRKINLQAHIFRHFKNEVVPFHCYICDFTTLKRNLIIEHFKKHPKHHSKCDETDYKNQLEIYTKKPMSYCCKKCTFVSGNYSCFKRHKLSHKTKAEADGGYLKYRCDKCKFKTSWPTSFKRHKLNHLNHLKPEEIPYFYCYHCPHKCKRKSSLQIHIFNHFKNEDVSFHCYICDFTTLNRNLIIEHFKKHPKHHSKCDETDYKNQLETYTKNQMRFSCEKCTYTSGKSSDFKFHQLTHKTNAKIDDRLLKYRCDKCKYKTSWCTSLKVHKLGHLKPEEIQYFYCYHCFYKSKWKYALKRHIFKHFKKEEIPFHCYICGFVTLKRESFKKHFKDHIKCEET